MPRRNSIQEDARMGFFAGVLLTAALATIYHRARTVEMRRANAALMAERETDNRAAARHESETIKAYARQVEALREREIIAIRELLKSRRQIEELKRIVRANGPVAAPVENRMAANA